MIEYVGGLLFKTPLSFAAMPQEFSSMFMAFEALLKKGAYVHNFYKQHGWKVEDFQLAARACMGLLTGTGVVVVKVDTLRLEIAERSRFDATVENSYVFGNQELICVHETENNPVLNA